MDPNGLSFCWTDPITRSFTCKDIWPENPPADCKGYGKHAGKSCGSRQCDPSLQCCKDDIDYGHGGSSPDPDSAPAPEPPPSEPKCPPPINGSMESKQTYVDCVSS